MIQIQTLKISISEIKKETRLGFKSYIPIRLTLNKLELFLQVLWPSLSKLEILGMFMKNKMKKIKVGMEI